MNNQKVYIISGAVGSGKTTYTQKMKKKGDVVIDMDKIVSALHGDNEAHPDYSDVMNVAMDARQAIYNSIKSRKDNWNNAYIITSNSKKDYVDELANSLDAEVVTMDASVDDCMDHILNDDTRENKSRDMDLAKLWYARR